MSTSNSPSTTSVPTVHVEPLHNPEHAAVVPEVRLENGKGKMLGAPGLLAKKLVAGGGAYCSPTDMAVSPCTAKLNASKQRHYSKGKPLSLSSSFQSSQSGSQLVPGGGGAKGSFMGDKVEGNENLKPMEL